MYLGKIENVYWAKKVSSCGLLVFLVTVLENKKGRGPCYLQTKGITKEQEQDLYKAIDKQRIGELLEMGETLKAGDGPSEGSRPVRSDHLIEDKLGPTKYSLVRKGSPPRGDLLSFLELYYFAQVAKIANCRKIDKLECKHNTPDKISIRDVTLGYLCTIFQ